MQHFDQIFKTRVFSRWAQKHGVNYEILMKAIGEMKNGLIDADLGGNLYKKRIALPGRGKRGGARTLIATNFNDRWVFLLGFAKNEQDNIPPADLVFWKNITQDLLSITQEKFKDLLEAGKLLEVKNED